MTVLYWGYLTIAALSLALVLAFIGFLFVKRLEARPTLPISEEIGSVKSVIKKARKGEPMSTDELTYAKQVVADRGSFMALCIPGALFMLGCFFVFGSLYHLHGATPSERTFLGVIPMLTSTNLAIQLLRHARLKRRLRKAACRRTALAGCDWACACCWRSGAVPIVFTFIGYWAHDRLLSGLREAGPGGVNTKFRSGSER